MHKVRGNYNSCTCKSSENICSSSGGVQAKGNRRGNRMKNSDWHKKWCISQSDTPLKANVQVFFNLTRFWTKLRVLVPCFSDFTENSVYSEGNLWFPIRTTWRLQQELFFGKKATIWKMQGLPNLSPQHLGSRSTCKSAHAERNGTSF
jgi:hypothetical protein